VPVRVSPVSRGAALLVVAIGVFTFFYVNDVAGTAFVALGVALYWLLYRLARRIGREMEEAVGSVR
jgi:membrane protein implicated in regulation of membrane protease activity